MAMLRRVYELSGLTAGQIAVSSGLPRSTAYRFIDKRNTTVPKNRDQVGAFLHACHLSREGVLNMLELWDEVNGITPAAEQNSAPAPRDPLDMDSSSRRSGIGLPSQRDPLDEDSRDPDERVAPKPPEAGFYPWEDPARWQQTTNQQLLGSQLVFVGPVAEALAAQYASGHLSSCPLCVDSEAPPKQHARRRTPTLMQWAIRVFPLILLLITIGPLTFAVWLGPRFTGPTAALVALELVMTILLTTVRWFQHPRGARMLTPTSLGAGLLTGLGTGVLAAFAVSVPFVGVLTGFAVFAAAPMWIGCTDLPGLTTVRGAFTLVAAAWCGLALGYAASLTMFPPLGAILVGALGAAMTVMQLSKYASGHHTPSEPMTSRSVP